MRYEKTVSVSKIRLLWEPWEEDETPRNTNTQVSGNREKAKLYFSGIRGVANKVLQVNTNLKGPTF